MLIKEIIESSKFKKDIDKVTLQNCIIALSALIHFLTTEIDMKIIYNDISDEMKKKLKENMKKMVDKCYNNIPEIYIGKRKEPDYWKKIYNLFESYLDKINE